MQGHHQYQPELFSQIDYEILIPKSHLLQRVDQVLDLSFLPSLTAPLYSESQGKPSIAPEILYAWFCLSIFIILTLTASSCNYDGTLIHFDVHPDVFNG